MRTIATHKVNECNEALQIEVVDAPGNGGAHHHYEISGYNASHNPSWWPDGSPCEMTIVFQNGPIKEAGVNGITNEALLAIVEDRLACFQNGPYACEENAVARAAVQKAMEVLHSRTLKREARGVEGTHTP